MKSIQSYIREEDGAVTVDWVVLTSAIVGLGIVVMSSIGSSTVGLADKVSGAIATATVWKF